MSYKVGDQVVFLGCNIWIIRPTKKLDYKYHGLLTIVKYVSSHTYQLELPVGFYNIHNVFYMSLLEPYRTIEG